MNLLDYNVVRRLSSCNNYNIKADKYPPFHLGVNSITSHLKVVILGSANQGRGETQAGFSPWHLASFEGAHTWNDLAMFGL